MKVPGDLPTVSVDASDQVTVLFLEGEVDALSVGELDSALARAAQRTMPVIIDVSPGAVLSRTIQLAGISARIPVFPDVASASAEAVNSRAEPGS